MGLEDLLQVAWKRIKVDRKTDFLIGNFEYAIYEKYKEELIKHVAEKFKREGKDYRPEPLRKIRVPKSSHTTRPGAVPTIDDRIIYQYLVDEIAEKVEPNLIPIEDGVVHSYRYAHDRYSENMFKYDSASYKTFQQKSVEYSECYNYIVVTDISDFFNRIYHHELESTLIGLGASQEITDVLMGILRKWQKGNSYSIPQGLWASDYIGNVYLDPIDKFMVRSGYNYFRYVDDIRIGVDTYIEGQKALLKLEQQIARYGLTLNAEKTMIIYKDDMDKLLFPYRERLQEIFDELWSEVPDFSPYSDDNFVEAITKDLNIRSLQNLFLEQLEQELPNASMTRFCLKKFRQLLDTGNLDVVLENIGKLVVVTPQLVNYLIFVSKHVESKYIVDTISEYISCGNSCYDWQIMWLLHCLDRIGEVDGEAVSYIRKYLLTKDNIHEAVSVNLILLIGKHGDIEDRNWLLDLYESQNSIWIKRAILFSIQDLPHAKRNHFYSYCKGIDLLTDKIIDFVQLKK